MQPWNVPGIVRVQRWRHGHPTHHATRTVTLSRDPQGQWLVEESRTTMGAKAFDSEDEARAAVARLAGGEGWVEVPAAYDANHRPIGDGWRRIGGQWVR